MWLLFLFAYTAVQKGKTVYTIQTWNEMATCIWSIDKNTDGTMIGYRTAMQPEEVDLILTYLIM